MAQSLRISEKYLKSTNTKTEIDYNGVFVIKVSQNAPIKHDFAER
jgi:hypothetical protein